MSRWEDLYILLRSMRMVAKCASDEIQRKTSQNWMNSSIRVSLTKNFSKVEDNINSTIFEDKFKNPIDVMNSNLDYAKKATENIRYKIKSRLPADIAPSFLKEELPEAVIVQNSLGKEKTDSSSETIPEDAKANKDVKFSRMSHRYPPSKIPEFLKKDLPYSILVETGLVDETEEEYRKRTAQPPPPTKSNKNLTPRQKYEAARENKKPKVLQGLSDKSKERKVPGTRIGRMASFGSLGAGLAFGAASEVFKRSVGLGKTKNSGNESLLKENPFLSDANMERIVNTLCRVRGAALKLGQMLSIQDASLMSPQLQLVMERVRQSADFMPKYQLEKVIREELGSNWREKFQSFDDKPFAAASIGQVHRGTTLDGKEVAVKIQYPGVSSSIDSDIENLLGILKYWKILPDALYVDRVVDVARKELKWECDYTREAECSERYRKLLENDDVFYVPKVFKDLSSGKILTTELVEGVSVDKVINENQDTRNAVSRNLLRLCLRELFDWNFMQTDPNWSNFLYDSKTGLISLIDFGATREYNKKFVDIYIKIIRAAADKDREQILKHSVDLGFLTGLESKVMQKAHCDAVLILGEAFATDKEFNFGNQSTAKRIHEIIPVMLKHRLTPPPEETYSLHRKMSGCFQLCSKLSANIECKSLFFDVWDKYRFDE
ncbi:DgyrCDS7050 [Dimorphilus gyrociliatus]|uniref:DgyrCDS7050 n=1 Tax=Dimorphilus gyrociliatus TaxID=2664684 RepID=A0A7I8VRH9_9ANNE|nr:DgyrCDS7050 [Dimorphilus gyrociliatus]